MKRLTVLGLLFLTLALMASLLPASTVGAQINGLTAATATRRRTTRSQAPSHLTSGQSARGMAMAESTPSTLNARTRRATHPVRRSR